MLAATTTIVAALGFVKFKQVQTAIAQSSTDVRLLVLRHERVEQVFTPAAGYDRVFECLAPLAEEEARLHQDTLLLTLSPLPVNVAERSECDRHLTEPKAASANAILTTSAVSRSRLA